MKIGTKLSVVIIGITIVPLIVISSFAFLNGRRALEKNTISRLEAVTTLKEAEFERWINGNMNFLQHVSEIEIVENYAGKLVELEPGSSEFLEYYQLLLDLSIFPALERWDGFEDLAIIRASDGLVLISNDKFVENKYRENEKYFIEGLNTLFVDDAIYSLSRQEVVMHIATPIRNESDEAIAVLVGHLNFQEMTNIMLKETSANRSEETYLVNTFNFFVTGSRFMPGAALTRAVYTQGVEDCLRGNNGVAFYDDYRQIEVVGVYHWLPESHMCILTEIDKAEAFSPVNKFRNAAIFGLFALSLIMSLVGIFFARNISKPILDLVAGVENIGRGDLEFKIHLDRDDEIGMLATAFDELNTNMAETQSENISLVMKLKSWGEELENRVEERTQDLKEAQLATLSMMEDAEEARLKAEQVNEELKSAQVATMNIMMDIEDARIKMEKANVALVQEKAFSDNIINSIPGVFYVFDEQGKFIRWNTNFSRITEYSHDEIDQMHPVQLFSGEDAEYIAARIQLAFEDGQSDAEADFTTKSGKKLPYYFTGFRTVIDDKPILIGTGLDISERIRAEKALATKAKELERSNKELEQFAYVASHDLQEPLRMVASYLQLLDRRYSEKLGDDAREFIDFAVDGAARMKRLINDLLAYSRVGTSGKQFEKASLQEVLEKVFVNLKSSIDENQAVITHDELPSIFSDETQLIQLFQNLIGNAIKFRKPDEVPQIHIGTVQKNGAWHFSISDNGIGFDPQFSERIFVIFQRLHGKNEYSGTGIGLAISKRIVERHGGRIWVESVPG